MRKRVVIIITAIAFLAYGISGPEADAQNSRNKKTSKVEQTSKSSKSNGGKKGTSKSGKSATSTGGKKVQKIGAGKNGKNNTSSQKTNKGKTNGKRSGTAGNSGVSTPESKRDLERRQRETQAEIAATREKIKENDREVSRNLKELGKLQEDITAGKQDLASITKRVNLLEGEISELQNKIGAGETELGRLKTEYLKAVKRMRNRKKTNSDLAYIFSSKSLSEANRRMRYLKEFSEWRKKQSAEIENKVKTLQKQRGDLARDKEVHSKEMNRQLAAQRKLENQYREQDALVVQLKSNGEALRAHLQRKQSEVNTLKSQVSALIAAEQRAEEARRAEAERQERERLAREQKSAENNQLAQTSGNRQEEETAKPGQTGKSKKDKTKKENKGKQKDSGNSGNAYADARRRRPRSDKAGQTGENSGVASKPGEVRSGSFEAMRGGLPRPVAGTFIITSPFGPHALPGLPDVKYDNPGIDARVDKGATAKAVYAGKVSGVYMIPGFSTVVIVNHGNYYTVYGNLATTMVKVGDAVKQGHAIGSVAVDEDDSAHGMLHFEVWRNREKLNPQQWIK